MILKRGSQSGSKTFGLAFITAIMVCVILNPLNSSTISVALPVLLPALHTNSSGITWIVSAYYLGSAIAQPVMGKLGDAWGRRRFVYVGLILMIITALMAPLSRSLTLFVLWRIVQAIGTSMIYPNAIGLLRQYRSGDIGRILGWIGMAGGVAVAIGPTIGGFLIDLATWHAVFWLNIPLSILSMVLFSRILPRETQSIKSPSKDKNVRLDYAGMLFFAAAVTAWLLWSNAKHPFMPTSLLAFIVSLILTGVMIWVEFRHVSPIIPVKWFRQRQFSLSSLITILTNLVMYCILYGLPVFLESVRGMSPTESGLMLLAFAGVMSLASPLGGRYAQGRGRRKPILISCILLLCGVLMLIWIASIPRFIIIVALALSGISFAISNVVIQKIVLDAAPVQETGQASGVYTLLRYVGTIVSSVLIGSNVSSGSGARALFILLSGLCCLTILLACGLRDSKPNAS